MDSCKVRRLSVASALAALLMVTVSACGGQEDFSDPAGTPDLNAQTETAQSATVVVDEPARETPTPYSRSVPSPVVVTATSVPTATVEAATAVSPATATPVAIDSPNANGFIAPTAVAVDVPTAVLASTPTATAVKTPIVQPFSTQAPTATATAEEMSGKWPTPQELGAVEWSKFEGRGYFTRTVSKGKTIRVYEGPTETREVTCGPEVGTAFDSSNPTWSEASHLIYVWSVIEVWGTGNCRGVSEYEDWINKPLPAAPLSQREILERRVAAGERLKFASDDSDRDYSTHPSDYAETYPPVKVTERGGAWKAYSWEGAVIWEATLDDGWVAHCGPASFPWANWLKGAGFYTIAIADEQAAYGNEWTDEELAMKDEARSRGWYFIYRSDLIPHKNFCWHVPNHEDIPPHRPCLECHWRGQ